MYVLQLLHSMHAAPCGAMRHARDGHGALKLIRYVLDVRSYGVAPDRPIPDTSTDTALCDVGSIARARI